ncbi:MAG TPA: polysaccharide biosynthesis tyrosine autokinase [Desulfatiglandales bacterium]|nr:polysaccharide biosynthesis tyrosine autokinase [Desulfatiglandales bacterium]
MAQYDINLREYWRILKKRKFIVIITAIILGLFSTIFAIFQAPTPLYTSVCSIKFEKETTLEGLYTRTLSWSEGDDIETQISIINGYSVLLEVAKAMGLIPGKSTGEDPAAITAVERIKGKVKVERENYTNILNISVTDPDPAFAQKLANRIASTYKRLHAEQQGKRTIDAIRYIENQLASVRDKLKLSEENFSRYSQANQLISIDMQSENLLLRKKELTDEIRQQNENKSDFKAISARVEKFIQDPSSSEVNFYSSRATPQYQASNDSLIELLLKRDSLLENYTSQHPEVIAIGQKITETARKILALLKQQIAAAGRKIADLEEESREVDSKTNLLMEKKLEYDRLKREVDSFRNMTALLEQKNQEALITQAEKPEEVVIVKPALLSTTPINPPKTMATGAMGIIIGIVLGLVFAFIVETFDTSLGAIEDVEATLGAKVLGVIPHVDYKDIIASLKDKIPSEMDESVLKKMINLASHFAPKTMIAESFRALRTNIQFSEGDKKIRTIAITSTSPQEGKTMVSANLAISLAQSGLKTLLVGSDLRKPMLGSLFGLEETPGLTEIILGDYPWNHTVKTITDIIIMGKISLDDVMMTPGMDNLNIITSGTIPPNPAELLESDRLTTFIEEAKKQYDILIFDSTPVLSAADAVILGQKMDGVLIVYRVGVVSKGLLKRTATQLQQVKCNIIGIILNGMKPDISPDFPDYKYYKYYSYYGKEEGRERSHSGVKSFWPFRRKGGDSESSVISPLPSGTEMADQEDNKGRSPILRWALIIFASLLLAAGILWQAGIFNPVRQDNRPDIRPSAGKKTLNETAEPEIRPVTSSSVENTVPETGVEHEEATVIVQTDNMTAHDDNNSIKDADYHSGSFPFSIYFGSSISKERVDATIAQYRREGLHPYWVKIDFKEKGIWYRIYAGYFKGQEQAQDVINKYNFTDAEIKNTPYANLIGVYDTEDALENITRTIEELGYSPYTVIDQEGRSALFVGAFITEQGAEEQNKELQSHDIHSRVVKR